MKYKCILYDCCTLISDFNLLYPHKYHWFFGTLYFQASLVCSFPLDALPCEEAPTFYEGPDSINAKFGLVEDYEEGEAY